MNKPLLFQDYFELGQPETESPFLTPSTRYLSANLTLKSAFLAALLLIITFIFSFFPPTEPISKILLVAVYFLAGIPSLIESIEDLINFEINIDILMTLAAFSSVFIGSGMEGGLLLVLFALSGSMEDAVTAKAKDAISSLHKLAPTTAFLLREDGTILEKSIKEIDVAEKILVKAGSVVPLDGVVVSGISSVNLVHLTGENFPVLKKQGDDVPSGAQNLEGSLTLKVTRTSSNSTVSRIIQLVTEAQESRPKLQRWFDSLSRGYALTIILLSTLFALSFPYLFNIPFLGVEGSVYRALTFLIAASPCALIIALPIAYLSALSIAAKRGILLKGGMVLDALAKVKAIAFDKTGTLTTGDLTCISFEGDETELALKLAVSLEQNANHPIAKAILNYGKGVKPVEITHFKSIPGYGVEGVYEGKTVYLGRPEYLGKSVQKEGEIVTTLFYDDKISIFRFADTLRTKMKETIHSLKTNRKLDVVMLTGDHPMSAKRVADQLGIENWHADLKPEQKLDFVTKLSQDQGLAMVGDGINDAPALAKATVGICMGEVGTTTAMEASDIVLLHDNIELIDWLIGKAHQTQTIVKQNLTIAIFAILIASTPALLGIVPLWLAVILHEGGTVLVGLNALRLLRK